MKATFAVCMSAAVLLAVTIPLRLAAREKATGAANPVPLVNQPLIPASVAPGGGGFTLTVNGTGFVQGSTVNWNGSPRATNFVNGLQLTADILASDVAKASTASVTVVNPVPGGGTSNVVYFGVSRGFSVALSGSNYGTVPQSFSIITADFNRDGNLDMAATSAEGNVSVFLGNGDGTFRSQVDYVVGNGVAIAVADFNGDGFLDLAVADSLAGTVDILLGNGDGTFQSHIDYPVGSGPQAVAVGDFNGDGKLDLAVANLGSDTLSILLGNGDGSFQPEVEYATGGGEPASVAIGDFNGDGKLDLVVATQDATDLVSVLIGNGDGTFQPYLQYTASWEPDAVTTADFNGDGRLDLAVASFGGNVVSILLGNGDGTFQPHLDYAAGGGCTSVQLGDINGDGKLDLAVVNYATNTVSVLLGNGDGSFQPHVDYATGTQPESAAVGDFNGDGRFDLAVSDYSGNAVNVLLEATTINLVPSSLSFGSVLVGTQAASQKVSLTNIGSLALSITSIAVTGTDPGDFPASNNCGSSVPPGASCRIEVTFKPAQIGPRTASVSITDNAPGSPQTVPLGGTGVTSGPNATLSASSLRFGAQLIGTTSSAQSVTLSNYGTTSLSIANITVNGNFSESNSCGSSLPSGASCTISVIFKPTQRGTRNGTLAIVDNAPNSPQKVSLTGMGTVVELNPVSLDFGTVTVGQTKTLPTTLTNVGVTGLSISSITITGDFADYSQTNTCDGSVGAGQSCTISVTFKPSVAGSYSGDVAVADNGGASPQQVTLSGTGGTTCGGRCLQGHCPTGCHCSGFFCVSNSAPDDLLKESLLLQDWLSPGTCGK
jgi:hypothetical protein